MHNYYKKKISPIKVDKKTKIFIRSRPPEAIATSGTVVWWVGVLAEWEEESDGFP